MIRNATLTALLLALLATGAACAGVSPLGLKIGVEPFGGMSFPILQDDSKSGSTFGVRLPVGVLPLLTLEPYWASSTLGDVTQTFAGLSYTRDGGQVRALGVNALLMTGTPMVRFYPYAGIGSHKLTRDGSDDLTKVGYNFGLGLGLSPVPKIGIDARGEFNLIAIDQASRKFANVTLGAAYHF